MPLAILDVVCGVSDLRVDVYVEEEAVECPAGKGHLTPLLVEGKVAHIDRARALEYYLGEPCHIAIVLDNAIR